MAGKTDSHSDGVLNTARGSALAAWTPYVGLLSAAPSDTTAGTEIAGGGYARQAITFGAPANATPGRVVANTNVITFGPATGADWLNAQWFAFYDAATAGAIRYWALLDVAKLVALGDSASFAAGTLTMKED